MELSQSILLGSAPESVAADFDKAFRQDVLKEAGDELLGWKRDAVQLLSAIIAIAKSDLPLLESFQPAVDDGSTEDVSRQILEDFFSGTGVAAMNIPGLLPARIARVEPTPSLQGGLKLGAEDPAQGIARN